MISFNIKSNILYAIDCKGIAIVNKTDGSHSFLLYPEAIVWAILSENYPITKSKQIIKAILNKPDKDSENFIIQCLQKWKDLNFIL